MLGKIRNQWEPEVPHSSPARTEKKMVQSKRYSGRMRAFHARALSSLGSSTKIDWKREISRFNPTKHLRTSIYWARLDVRLKKKKQPNCLWSTDGSRQIPSTPLHFAMASSFHYFYRSITDHCLNKIHHSTLIRLEFLLAAEKTILYGIGDQWRPIISANELATS